MASKSTVEFSSSIKTAVADITPETQIPLSGFAHRTERFNKVASKLEANVIVFGDNNSAFALIAIDTLFSSELLRRTIEEKLSNLGIASVTQISLVASHTHFAPSLDPEKPLLGDCDSTYLAFVADRISNAISKALRTSGQSCRAFYASEKLGGSIYRRRTIRYLQLRKMRIVTETVQAPNSAEIHNKNLQLLVLKNDSGRTISVIWTWPCHAVSSPDQADVSADFPGRVRSALRDTFGDASLAVLYFPGFAGDIRPYSRRSWAHPKSLRLYPGSFTDTFAPMTSKSSCVFYENCCIAARKAVESARLVETESTVTLKRSDIPLQDILEGSVVNQGAMPLIHFSCGSLKIVLAGAEICSGYYNLVGFDENKPLFVTGYLDRCFGYYPTNAQMSAGGYEVDRFLRFFSIHGKFYGDLEHQLSKCIARIEFKA